jgi:16S rRNA (guanine(966)-N(2))-methyltransferase RsmD
MRIISGQLGGRRIHPPKNMQARPTTDLAKEGLFNTLQSMLDFEDCRCLELFAGTGNISFELISRGAQHATLIEKDPLLVAFIKKTAQEFKIEEQLQILPANALQWISSGSVSYDLIFVDPPYAIPEMKQLPDMILSSNLLDKEGLLILEHTLNVNFENHPNFTKQKKYGTTFFSFFKH